LQRPVLFEFDYMPQPEHKWKHYQMKHEPHWF
jgi:hypothetical protein